MPKTTVETSTDKNTTSHGEPKQSAFLKAVAAPDQNKTDMSASIIAVLFDRFILIITIHLIPPKTAESSILISHRTNKT